MTPPIREPTAAETSSPLRLPSMPAYRSAAARRRSAAFCDAPEYVLSTRVLPLTPRTFSMLHATGNRFILGGTIRESDVRNYVWFHSPLYAHIAVRGWRWRKRRALWRLHLLTAQPLRRLFFRRPSVERYAAILALATTDIQMLVDEAFADGPSSSNKGKPFPATLESQLIHEFAAAYGWSAGTTRNTPLKQLFQMLRCIAVAHGAEVRDRGEEDILARHLEARNRQLAAEREKRATTAAPSAQTN